MGMQEISKAYRQRAGLDQIEDEPEVVVEPEPEPEPEPEDED